MNYQSAIARMQAMVVQKAMEDGAFKSELLANPRGTVEKVFNVALPAEVKIELQQAAANTVVLSLPYELEGGKDGELSDSDLESVAGGSKAGARSFFNNVGSGIAFGGTALVAGATGTTKLLEGSAVKIGETCFG